MYMIPLVNLIIIAVSSFCDNVNIKTKNKPGSPVT
jgi:hypothetical protein